MKKFAFLPALMAIAAITPSLTVARDTQILQTAPLPATNFVPPPSPYDGTNTLRYFRSKCTLIVVASVTSALGHSGSRPIYEPGVVKLAPSDELVGITVERVLCGTAPHEKSFPIHLYQLGTQNGVSGISAQFNQRYIFFLKPSDSQTQISLESPAGTIVKKETVVWQTADIWFGIYPFDTALAAELCKLEDGK